jgi:hypothetical protein
MCEGGVQPRLSMPLIIELVWKRIEEGVDARKTLCTEEENKRRV